jgi:hypothetical protein
MARRRNIAKHKEISIWFGNPGKIDASCISKIRQELSNSASYKKCSRWRDSPGIFIDLSI